jgi:hypothetical protein
MHQGHGAARHVERARHELVEFALIAAYLFVCFGAVILYRAAVLADHGVAPTALGLALLKSLLIAKFMLVGHALKVGDWLDGAPLARVILYRSSLFLALLIVLDAIEEIVVGAMHGRGPMEVASDIASGRILEMLANGLLMWLILLPYFGAREISAVLGPGVMRRLLLVGPTEAERRAAAD